jgi:hypothetical protein
MIDMRVQGYKLGLIPNIKAAAGHILVLRGYDESID